MEASHVLWFGFSLSLAGAVFLALAVNLLTSFLAATTLLSYLFLYTPLKRKTPLSTLVDAFSGGIPPLIGWARRADGLTRKRGRYVRLVFLWQFLHFMAIAWMYREDYARAGYFVLPAGRLRDRLVIWQSFAVSLILVPLSLIPALMHETGVVYSARALILGPIFYYYSASLAFRRSSLTARRLLAHRSFTFPHCLF